VSWPYLVRVLIKIVKLIYYQMATKFADLSKEQKQEVFEKLRNFYKEINHPEWLGLPVVETEVINNLSQKVQSTRKILKITGVAPPREAESANKIKKELEELLKDVSSTAISVSAEYGVGSQFKKIKNVYALSGEDKNGYFSLEHQKDEVLVMLFWNTVNSDSVKALKNIHEFMAARSKNNSEGNVRFVTLSIDSEVQYPINDTKKMQHALHCNVIENQFCDALYDFEFESAPHLVIVDKDGKIASSQEYKN
jgi:hypothetical protein